MSLEMNPFEQEIWTENSKALEESEMTRLFEDKISFSS